MEHAETKIAARLLRKRTLIISIGLSVCEIINRLYEKESHGNEIYFLTDNGEVDKAAESHSQSIDRFKIEKGLREEDLVGPLVVAAFWIKELSKKDPKNFFGFRSRSEIKKLPDNILTAFSMPLLSFHLSCSILNIDWDSVPDIVASEFMYILGNDRSDISIQWLIWALRNFQIAFSGKSSQQ